MVKCYGCFKVKECKKSLRIIAINDVQRNECISVWIYDEPVLKERTGPGSVKLNLKK